MLGCLAVGIWILYGAAGWLIFRMASVVIGKPFRWLDNVAFLVPGIMLGPIWLLAGIYSLGCATEDFVKKRGPTPEVASIQTAGQNTATYCTIHANSAPSAPDKTPWPQRYRCHKEVNAFKIAAMVAPDPALGLPAFLQSDDPNMSRPVSQWWIDKNKPEIGGYYVRHDDGYQSYSSAKEFESLYTKVE